MPQQDFLLRFAGLKQTWHCDVTGDKPSYSRTLDAFAAVRGQLTAVGETSDVPTRRISTVHVALIPTRPENVALREATHTHAGQLFIERSDRKLIHEAHLMLEVAAADFEELWGMAGKPMALSILAGVAGASAGDSAAHSASLVMPVEQYGPRTKVVARRLEASLDVSLEVEARRNEVLAARARDLQEAFSDYCFGERYGSQVKRIFDELSLGLAQVDDLEQREDQFRAVVGLLGDARRIYREELKGTGREYDDNAYLLSKAGFLEYIKQYDTAKQTLLKERYDGLWRHYKLTDAIQRGQAKGGPAQDGIRCFAEDIEPLAKDYLALGLPRSATLEWLLLDSLVYSECLGLAQLVNSPKSSFGSPVAMPLEPMSAGRSAGKGLLDWSMKAGVEVVTLAATYAVAHVLTQGDSTSTWVVVTGVSAARWVRSAMAAKVPTPQETMRTLLEKMVLVSESLQRLDFNPRNLRQHIHALTQEGVSFSPCVLNLLDRQIEEPVRG